MTRWSLLLQTPSSSYTTSWDSTHDDALYAHFETVAAATRLGLLFHERRLLGRGVLRPWSLDLIKRVAAIDNVIGMKEESGDFAYSMEILAEVGKDIAMIDDAGKISFIVTHGYGSPAYITGIGQYAPQVSRSFWNALESGDLAEARRIAVDIDVARQRLYGRFGWLGFIKASMELCGLPGSPIRQPGISLTVGQKEEVRQLLDRLNLLPN